MSQAACGLTHCYADILTGEFYEGKNEKRIYYFIFYITYTFELPTMRP